MAANEGMISMNDQQTEASANASGGATAAKTSTVITGNSLIMEEKGEDVSGNLGGMGTKILNDAPGGGSPASLNEQPQGEMGQHLGASLVIERGDRKLEEEKSAVKSDVKSDAKSAIGKQMVHDVIAHPELDRVALARPGLHGLRHLITLATRQVLHRHPNLVFDSKNFYRDEKEGMTPTQIAEKWMCDHPEEAISIDIAVRSQLREDAKNNPLLFAYGLEKTDFSQNHEYQSVAADLYQEALACYGREAVVCSLLNIVQPSEPMPPTPEEVLQQISASFKESAV